MISPLLAKMSFEITLSDQILDDLSNIDGNLGLENLYSKDKEAGVVEVLVKNVMNGGSKIEMERGEERSGRREGGEERWEEGIKWNGDRGGEGEGMKEELGGGKRANWREQVF